MSKSNLIDMTCREYAETMHPGWGEFSVKGDGDLIYLHAGSRLRITCERHSQPGFGFDRMEAIDESYHEHGKCSSDRDAEEFAKDFIEHFCDHLSIHQLNVLIPALTAHRDAWERRRQEAAALATSKFSGQ